MGCIAISTAGLCIDGCFSGGRGIRFQAPVVPAIEIHDSDDFPAGEFHCASFGLWCAFCRDGEYCDKACVNGFRICNSLELAEARNWLAHFDGCSHTDRSTRTGAIVAMAKEEPV